MNGKSMAGKKGPGSVGIEELSKGVGTSVEQFKRLPTGFESDYERVEQDEQCDDWNGFPKPCP